VLAVATVVYLLTLTHYERTDICHQFLLPAYAQVTNFCHIFGLGNIGRLICGTAYREYIRYLNIQRSLIKVTGSYNSFIAIAKHQKLTMDGPGI